MSVGADLHLSATLPRSLTGGPTDVTALVAAGAAELARRLGLDIDVVAHVEIADSEPSIRVDVAHSPHGWVQASTDRLAQVVATASQTTTDAAYPWLVKMWTQMTLSGAPGMLISDATAAAHWSTFASSTVQDMPDWYPDHLRRVVTLGLEVPTPDSTLLLSAAPVVTDSGWLAEAALARKFRPLELAASLETLRRLADFVHDGDRDIEAGIAHDLGVAGVLAPALTLAPDPSVPAEMCEIRLGHLTLGLTVVPPRQVFLAHLSAYLLTGEGILSRQERNVSWARLRADSPAAEEARSRFGCHEADFLVRAVCQALEPALHLAPDRRGVERLLDQLFEHTGSGHTVWFARHALSTEQVLMVVRSMMISGVPLTDLPPVLREVLAGLDMDQPSLDNFVASLATALRYRREIAANMHEHSVHPA